MQHILSSSVILAAMALSSSAHTIFQEMYVNGVDQGHLTGIRVPDYDGVRSSLPFPSRPLFSSNPSWILTSHVCV